MTQQRSEAASASCEHHWVSAHQPDFPQALYWVDRCSQCGAFSGARLAEQIAPLLARAERAEAQVRAVERLHVWTNEDGRRFVFADDLAVALEIPGAVPAGLSLQEEQPTHLVGAGGWRACDTAADWAGSDTTGVTCAECLATTTDVLQEEQE